MHEDGQSSCGVDGDMAQDELNAPLIIALPSASKKDFRWMSGGWNTDDQKDTPRAKELMRTAVDCIEGGRNRKDVIERLKRAGFRVEVRK